MAKNSEIGKLSLYLRDVRAGELEKARNAGKKIVAFPPGNWVPDELIYAVGAIPVSILRGGDPEAVTESSAYVPRFIDTFCRSQIGYWSLREDPLYQMIDLLVCPTTDNNQRGIGDTWGYWTNVPVFRYGVPHNKEPVGFEYYLEGLRLLRKRLEELTGEKLKDDRLKEAIKLYDRIRQVLREISLLRISKELPISGKDFVRLNHFSYLLDPVFYIESLERILAEVKQAKGQIKSPRLLLTASTLAYGDYKVLNLVEETNAAIVIEEIPEGVRNYWEDVGLDGDPLVQLAHTYFMKKVPPAYFRPSHERIDFMLKLAREFEVDGVIWYQLMYRESYDAQEVYFTKIFKEKLGIPVLKLQSDYDRAETGTFKTRIETFLETVRK